MKGFSETREGMCSRVSLVRRGVPASTALPQQPRALASSFLGDGSHDVSRARGATSPLPKPRHPPFSVTLGPRPCEGNVQAGGVGWAVGYRGQRFFVGTVC